MRFFFVLWLQLCLAPWALAAGALITPQELNSALQAKGAQAQWRVIDIRDSFSFEQQHIPGSVNAPYSQWRATGANPGQVAPVAQLAQMLGQLGIQAQHRVVVASTGEDTLDFGAAARVYWTLKYLGVNHIALLEGGLFAWDEANLPMDAGPADAPQAVQFVPSLRTDWLANTDEVKQLVQSGRGRLIDARPKAFFSGLTRVPQAKAAGTLPGAVNLDNERWFDAQGARLVGKAKADELVQQTQMINGQPTVLFCNTGHLAATNWFVLSEVLGHTQVKLYPGSMVEWTQQSQALPMANEPRRWQQLWMDARLWYRQRFE